ncbi:MAG: methyltransferase domain-containing protein [Bacteroidetes bacterium]|nr:MAG: methyltransferase domain-containing protein [Bacteroidota bacterium]
MRLMQHKKEAYWFYWYLSNFYDKFVNPLFWTARMRDESLSIAQLDSPGLKVIDVGSGTGFTTQGIVEHVPASQVTCVDQSPHQMSKAKRKADLQGCTFLLGDAENIPFPTDSFDRYVSAGSIEYWPDPQKGVTESYRVIKPGGIALLIGPLEPVNRFSRFIADTWMLFPKDSEYREWYKNAGFTDIQVRYVRPAWYRSKVEYGIAIAGRKPAPGESPYVAPAKAPVEEGPLTLGRRLQLIWRVVAGSTAGFLFIPGALIGYLRTAFDQRGQDIPAKYREGLNGYQITALLVIAAIIGGIVWRVL